jgi:cell division control protein 11
MKPGKRLGACLQLDLTPSSFSEIVEYLEREYDNILAEESRIKRNPRFKDNRVHVLLYFITPTGHG